MRARCDGLTVTGPEQRGACREAPAAPAAPVVGHAGPIGSRHAVAIRLPTRRPRFPSKHHLRIPAWRVVPPGQAVSGLPITATGEPPGAVLVRSAECLQEGNWPAAHSRDLLRCCRPGTALAPPHQVPAPAAGPCPAAAPRPPIQPAAARRNALAGSGRRPSRVIQAPFLAKKRPSARTGVAAAAGWPQLKRSGSAFRWTDRTGSGVAASHRPGRAEVLPLAVISPPRRQMSCKLDAVCAAFQPLQVAA